MIPDQKKYKVVVFDLDGTLTESKSKMTIEMSDLLSSLLEEHYVAIVSGGAFPQYQKQILDGLGHIGDGLKNHLYLFPTNGSSLYLYKDNNWVCEYEELLNTDEKTKIMHAWNEALKQTKIILPTPSYGPVIEDRATQISFSGCGQSAPIEIKSVWDPKMEKRSALRDVMLPFLPDFSISLGGMSTIDVTRKGIDKAYSINKIISYLGVIKSDIMFVGDKLEPGGNDFPARASGADCVEVSGPKETEKVIKKLISK